MNNTDKLQKKLAFAAKVMRCLPEVASKGYISVWPDIIYSPEELLEQAPALKKFKATGQDITKMDKILEWLRPLDSFETKLVWKRANNVPWKVISRDFHSDRTTLWRKYQCALVKALSHVPSQDRDFLEEDDD